MNDNSIRELYNFTKVWRKNSEILIAESCGKEIGLLERECERKRCTDIYKEENKVLRNEYIRIKRK